MSASVVYRRSLARVERLIPGEWTEETASGKPALCCADCGAIYDVPETHRIEPSGLIVPAVKCPTVTCFAFSYLKLEAWGRRWSGDRGAALAARGARARVRVRRGGQRLRVVPLALESRMIRFARAAASEAPVFLVMTSGERATRSTPREPARATRASAAVVRRAACLRRARTATPTAAGTLGWSAP